GDLLERLFQASKIERQHRPAFLAHRGGGEEGRPTFTFPSDALFRNLSRLSPVVWMPKVVAICRWKLDGQRCSNHLIRRLNRHKHHADRGAHAALLKSGSSSRRTDRAMPIRRSRKGSGVWMRGVLSVPPPRAPTSPRRLARLRPMRSTTAGSSFMGL